MPRAELVWAGHEPQEFCHLFPVWRQEEEAVKANEQVREAVLGKCILNMGIPIICLKPVLYSVTTVSPHSSPQAVSSSDLEATFSLLSRTSYSWEELQQRPLPHGVDPARIEAYLDTQAFQVSNAHWRKNKY